MHNQCLNAALVKSDDLAPLVDIHHHSLRFFDRPGMSSMFPASTTNKTCSCCQVRVGYREHPVPGSSKELGVI